MMTLVLNIIVSIATMIIGRRPTDLGEGRIMVKVQERVKVKVESFRFLEVQILALVQVITLLVGRANEAVGRVNHDRIRMKKTAVF